MRKKSAEIISIVFVVIFMFLTVFDGKTGRTGTLKGLLLCGNVIIPSVFSFTFLSLYLAKSSIINYLTKCSKITSRFFGLSGYEFFIFLMAQIGGYPCGIKLLNNAVNSRKIDKERAKLMSYFCVSAGPAFSVTAIGIGFFNNIKLGFILYISQILTSFVILCLTNPLRKNLITMKRKSSAFSVSENFITSAYDASKTTINICSFVVLFSFINAYVDYFSKYFKPLKIFKYILEITNAAEVTRNVFLLSFLLGFSGLSIILQVLSIGKDIEIDYIKFVFFRLLAGILNLIFTKLLLLSFPIYYETMNKVRPSFLNIYSAPELTVSLILTIIVFLISISSKKITGNIKEDVV